MAKRIGVLEVDDHLSAEPRKHVSKNVANYLCRKLLAVRVAPMLIRMLRAQAARLFSELTIGFWDGPLGVGNVLPFAKQSDGKPLHYEIPALGDHRRRWMNRFMAGPDK